MYEGDWAIGCDGRQDRIVTFTRHGEAWLVKAGIGGNAPILSGVAMEHKDVLIVARGVVTQSAELAGSVGIVRYDISDLGVLPARWYHPSLGASLSDGLSTDGPLQSLFGEYRADYSDGAGAAFDPLRKTITEDGDHVQVAWWDETRFHYLGVGETDDDSLYVAWGPPGSIIQFVRYRHTHAADTLQGRWLDYGRGRQGTETLIRLPA